MSHAAFTAPPAAPLFDAVLTPNDSAGPAGRRALWAFFAAYAVVSALLWASIGAWPALGHGTLVGGFLAWSARADRRRAAQWERIIIRPDKTTVEKGVGETPSERVEWPTPWLRAAFDGPDSPYVKLGCSGRETLLGGFLSPDDRRSFAAALASALAAARPAPSFSSSGLLTVGDLTARA
jgi:uncharacterized membrane protein